MARTGLIPTFLIRRLQEGRRNGSLQGSVLFLDISGFTKMTGELAAHAKDGAEVLSKAINRVFAPVLQFIDEDRGFVSTFAGDALTAIFPNVGPERVVETAQRIAAAFDREYVQETPFGEFTLEMKIGIAEGAVDWGIVGTGNNLAGYFHGDAVDEAALAEHSAGPGEIILPVQAAALLPDSFAFEAKGTEYARSVRNPPTGKVQARGGRNVGPATAAAERQINDDAFQRRFLPKTVIDNDSAGEFRTVASVFIGFDDPHDHDQIARAVEPILGLVDDFGGYFNVLDFGDKGGIALVVFGAPRSLGSMTQRSVGFASEVVRCCGSKVRVGLTSGTAFAGFVGSALRSTYTVLGPSVNLAARLALAAEPGNVIAAGEIASSLGESARPLGPWSLKGFPSPVSAFRILTDEEPETRREDVAVAQESSGHPLDAAGASMPGAIERGHGLYGRDEELGQIREWIAPITEETAGRLLVISVEAGAGKSVLAHAAFDELTDGLTVAWMYSDTILRKSLNPFKGFLEWCFRAKGLAVPRLGDTGLGDRLDELMEKASLGGDESEKSALREGSPALVSLLGGAIEDDRFQQLAPQARFERGVRALLALLHLFAREHPLLVVIEDAQAIDADSAIVLERFLRMKSTAGHAISLLTRTVDAPVASNLMDQAGDSTTRVELRSLSFDAMSEIIAGELHGPPAGALVEYVLRRVGANPYYAKELAAYLVRNRMVRRGEHGYDLTSSQVSLPEGISTLMLSRFDSLSTEVQSVARVAALLGSEFRIGEVEMVLGREAVARAMQQPDSQTIWVDDGSGVCRFRQELVRETIERTQLDASLRETHGRIADALAEHAKGDPSRYADLAHHSDLAGRAQDAQNYLKLAAEYATTNFKNEKAIEFYVRFIERAATVDEKISALGAISEIYNVVGKWAEAESSLVFAIGLCVVARDVRTRVRLMTKLGEVYQRRGNGREAVSVVESSVALARRVADHGLLTDALIEYGKIQSGKGDFRGAGKSLNEAIKESRLEGDARREGLSLYYRGVVFRDQNRYEDALGCYNQATSRFEAAKDDRLLTYPLYDMAVVHQYTGATDESRRRFEDVIRVYERIGYRSGTAAAVLNLGVLEDRKGDFAGAQRYFKQSREIADEIGERLASAYALFSMGATYYKMRDYRRSLYYLKQSYEMLKTLDARGYYGYPLSYLVCLYADTGAAEQAVRAAYLHLKTVKEIGSDVENGRADLGLALALSNGMPHTKLARDLLTRISEAAGIGAPTAEAFFRRAISQASTNGYVNTLIPALHQFGHFLLERDRTEEANLNLERAYRTAVEAKWEHFVSTFESDHPDLVRTLHRQSEGPIVAH